eukprot:Gregarina_sp_Poly_1__9000@NODE_547_length_7572_cov_311_443438_g434_i0_p10_GENE_NODE_547_length_7572_cov_311_443438_g434_i0NODE_547_length_7572_cov_311_443438_g434_i0_p10_ORF_typecomplete_len104_score12_04_NODE_547_length_7572_cov_311_443438_g434_i063216632
MSARFDLTPLSTRFPFFGVQLAASNQRVSLLLDTTTEGIRLHDGSSTGHSWCSSPEAFCPDRPALPLPHSEADNDNLSAADHSTNAKFTCGFRTVAAQAFHYQ